MKRYMNYYKRYTKYYFGIFAVLLFFFCFTTCEKTEEKPEETTEYKNIVRVLNVMYSTYSDSTGSYLNTLNNINLAGCPDDFCSAFNSHKKAVYNLDDFFPTYSFWGGFLSGLCLLGDGGACAGLGMAADGEEYSRLKELVLRTYTRCLLVAKKYGVDTALYQQ